MAGEILDNQGRGDAAVAWPSIHPEGRKFGLIAAAALRRLRVSRRGRRSPGRSRFLIARRARLLPRSRAGGAAGRAADRLAGRRPGLADRAGRAAAPSCMVDDGSGSRRAERRRRSRASRSSCRCSTCTSTARPIGGTVRRVVYIPGKFVNADLDKASDDNERQHILIERGDGRADRLHPDRRAGRAADRAVRQAGRHRRGRASGSG